MIVGKLTVVSVKLTATELERLDEIAEEHYAHNRSRAIVAALHELRVKHAIKPTVEARIMKKRAKLRIRAGAHASR